ncbi:MAG: hypothetical protein ACM3SY_08660 [Candidatus Omnitrophota bacterium]
MDIRNRQIEALLEKAKLAFENAKEQEEIKLCISRFGYEDNRLQELIGLYSETNDKYLSQKRLYGLCAEISGQCNEKWKVEQTRYMDYRTIAFRAFSGPADQKYYDSLGIGAEMARSMQGFISQARHFYQNAISRKDILDRLAYFVVKAEDLQAGLTGLNELERLNNLQVANAGLAQRATKTRDDSYKNLLSAYTSFVKISKIGLRGSPQLREVLGIRERSVPVRKRENSDNQPPDTNPAAAEASDAGLEIAE